MFRIIVTVRHGNVRAVLYACTKLWLILTQIVENIDGAIDMVISCSGLEL